MKIGILTFQFPYNYGAMLQAFALKTYIAQMGHEVMVLPYYPLHFKRAYSISPFTDGLTIRRRVRNALLYFRKISQVRKFENFKREKIYGGILEEVSSIAELQKYTKDLHLVLYGSDQIWNDRLTNEDETYYGYGIRVRKIAYAASMGTRKGSIAQKRLIRKYLPTFDELSVREPDSQKIIKNEINVVPKIVCDPVFLLPREKWETIEIPVKIYQEYMLVYMLQQDDELINNAKEYAYEHQLHIIEIHPTLDIHQAGTQLLTNVGPQEFLWLVHHAECICTNSFHGVSFSIIYKKKLFHKPNRNSPERSIAILQQVGVDISDQEYAEVDMEKVDNSSLHTFIRTSMSYLQTTLGYN